MSCIESKHVGGIVVGIGAAGFEVLRELRLAPHDEYATQSISVGEGARVWRTPELRPDATLAPHGDVYSENWLSDVRERLSLEWRAGATFLIVVVDSEDRTARAIAEQVIPRD